MKVSYAITVCNELEEIINLLNFLFKNAKPTDEIVVLYDSKNGSEEVWACLNLVALSDDNKFENFKLHQKEFNNNFADWKNHLNSLCAGDYIINIDADEIPNEFFINFIYYILENSTVDLIRVPRVNTVEGLTPEHIKKWGWRVDPEGRVNFPDYQARVYKNSPNIKWEGKVHETIKGYKTYLNLPQIEEWSFYHSKTIEKQEKQNNLYNNL